MPGINGAARRKGTRSAAHEQTRERAPFNRRILILLLIAAAAVVAAGYFMLRPGPPAGIEWQGYADADFVKVGPTQQGLVTAVHVARGDRVVKGQALFEQDDVNDRAAVDQAARLLRQAEDQLKNLKNSGKPTEVAQAEANLADAEASRDKVRTDLQRNQPLLKKGSATAQTCRSAAGRLPLRGGQDERDARPARPNPRAHGPARRDRSAERSGRRGAGRARASAMAARSAPSRRARRRRHRRRARPARRNARCRRPVVSLLPPENIFVRFFVPEPELARLIWATPSCWPATIARRK